MAVRIKQWGVPAPLGVRNIARTAGDKVSKMKDEECCEEEEGCTEPWFAQDSPGLCLSWSNYYTLTSLPWTIYLSLLKGPSLMKNNYIILIVSNY